MTTYHCHFHEGPLCGQTQNIPLTVRPNLTAYTHVPWAERPDELMQYYAELCLSSVDVHLQFLGWVPKRLDAGPSENTDVCKDAR